MSEKADLFGQSSCKFANQSQKRREKKRKYGETRDKVDVILGFKFFQQWSQSFEQTPLFIAPTKSSEKLRL